MSLQSFKSWLEEDEEEEKQQTSTSQPIEPEIQTTTVNNVNTAPDRDRFKSWLEQEDEANQVTEVREQGQQRVEDIAQPEEEPEEDKGFFRKAGDFIKNIFLGEKKEGDKRSDWQIFQEKYIGFESKAGKEEREAKKEYYEALQTGEEEVDTIEESQDMVKLKSYEILKEKIEFFDNVVVPEIEEKGMDKYDEIKKKHGVENWNIGDLRAGMRVLEESLGMSYISEGFIPEFIRKVDEGFSKGNAFNEDGSPNFAIGFSTEVDKRGLEAQKKLEKEGWEALTDDEQIDIVSTYAKSLWQERDADDSLMENVYQLVANSLGYGFGMSASTALTAGGMPEPTSQAQGIMKVLDTAIIKGAKAIGMTPLYEGEIETRYYDMVTPEYLYLTDEVGDIVIEKMEEARREEGEGTQRLAQLAQFFEYYSEDLGEILNVGSDEMFKSLVNTKVFGSFAGWAVENLGKWGEGTIGQIIKEGKFDGVVGEFLEEELLEPILAQIENREYYGVRTPEGRERMLTEIIGFGLTGTGASIQAFMERRRKKKLSETIDIINNNKDKFGLPENRKVDEQGNIVSTDTDEVIVDKEDVLKDPVVPIDDDKYDEFLADIEAKEQEIKEQEGETYIEEGDEDRSQYTPEQEAGVQEVVKELQADIELGARKKVVTQDQEGEATIVVEGAVLPDYIPEDLRSREVLQEAVDAVLEDRIPSEGSKAWEAYQVLLQEGKNRVVAEELNTGKETLSNEQVADILMEMGTNDANGQLETVSADDYVITDQVMKSPNYQLQSLSTEQVLQADEDAQSMLEDPEAFLEERPYIEDQDNYDAPIIIDSDGKIIDGVGRLAGHLVNNDTEIEAYVATEQIQESEVQEPEAPELTPEEQEGLVNEVVNVKRKTGALMEDLKYSKEEQLNVVKDQWSKFSGSDAFPQVASMLDEAKSLEEAIGIIANETSSATIQSFGVRLDDYFKRENKKRMDEEEMTQEELERNLPFRTNKSKLQVLDSSQLKNTDLREFKQLNRELFGDENVEILEQILTPERQNALGRYVDDWIQIRSGQADLEAQSSYYHEAVHKALDMFLTPSEKQAMITQVKNLVGEKELKKQFGKLNAQERLRIKRFGSYAETKFQETADRVVSRSWIGVDNAVGRSSELESTDVDYLIDLSNSVGINPDQLFGSVVEERNADTGDVKYYLVEGEESAVHASNLIDSEALGMGHGEQVGNLEYRVSAIDSKIIEQQLKNPFVEVEAFDARNLPYHYDSSIASRQREYRIKYGITKNGKGEYRGSEVSDVDAMAEEWLAENIIDHINGQPTTFVGKLKAMVERFIDRWFRTMESIDTIDEFYQALLSGRLRERREKIERKEVKKFEKYLDLDNIDKTYGEVVEAFRVEGAVDYREVAKEFNTAKDFVTAVFTDFSEYAMDHRPTYFFDAYGDFTQIMPRANNLLEGGMIPQDVYEHPEWSISPQHKSKANQESWEALLEVRNRPEADLTVYRASPSKDLNIGDWITLSKEYAKMHMGDKDFKVHEFTIKAKDAVFAGDDINEFGYYPKDELIEMWEAEAKRREDVKYRTMEEEGLVPVKLPELVDLADQLNADIQVKGKLGKKKGMIKLGDFTPVAVNGKDSRIRILRKLFEPQGEEVVNAQTGEVETLPETDEQRRDRIEKIEKVFSHEIGHLFDWFGGEDNKTLSRGNLLGRVGNLVNFMRKEFRGYENKDIKNELKTLTQIWNPFDESLNDKYTKYRYKSKELYAEAVSVLLNDPAMVKKHAPNFYNAFTEFLARKTEVKNAYLGIIDSIKENDYIERRLERQERAYERAHNKRMSIEERKEARDKQKTWLEKVVIPVKTALVNKYTPYLHKVKKAYKESGIELSDYEATEQVLENLEYVDNNLGKYTRDVQENFFDPISEAEIDVVDVGRVLELERDLGDRIDLANPHGLVYDYAKETYDKLREDLGATKWAILKKKLDWWRDYNYELVKKAYEAGVYSKEFFEEIATVNKNTYTPFAVVKYIDSNYISAGIIQATGTVSDVENPVTTQMMKSISIIEQTLTNQAKTSVVNIIKDINPEDLKKAKAQRGKDGRFTGWENNQELRDLGFDIIELREDGKKVGYWIDGYIKDMFESPLSGRDWTLVRKILYFMEQFHAIFKPAVTVLKPSFQFYSNPIKDYKRSLVNITGLSALFEEGSTAVRTGKMFKAFTAEWFKNLKRSWNYAHGRLDKVTTKMLDLHVFSQHLDYEDVELGTKKFQFDPVKKQVFYKTKQNWIESAVEWGRKLPAIGKVITVLDEIYFMGGKMLEANSKIAGFQVLEPRAGEQKAARWTRKYVGTPDYRQGGRFTRISNNVIPFSNVAVQALDADSRLATQPSTASGYWFSTFMTRIVPKLIMLAGATLLKVKVKPDDEEEKEVNPYDYISEYYKSMYNAFPIGYDSENDKFLFIKIPNDEIGGLVGNLVWKMGRYLQGEGMKIEQLGSAFVSLIPFLSGESPVTSLGNDWLGYMQGRNPYDDYRGRLAINPTKWQEGGITRFTEMLKWSSNEMGLTNFQTFDRQFHTTREHVLEAPLLERMFELSNYGLQERDIWEDMKAKKEKSKDRDKLLQDYYAQPSDKMMLKKIDQYIKQVKGEEPEEGWSGDDKAEATRLKNDFKMEILAQSGDRKYTRVAKYGISNDEKEDIIKGYQSRMDTQEFSDYMAQLVRHEVVKGEMFAQYALDNEVSNDIVYNVVKQSIPVLTQDSNNTLVWELRKRDMLSDDSLRKLYREDKLITRKGYLKYRKLDSRVYERRYEKDTDTKEDERDRLF